MSSLMGIARKVRRGLRHRGGDQGPSAPFLPDLDEHDRDVIRRVQPYTLTSPERIYALIHAIEYVVRCSIPGDIVECGVWKGGSMMAVAYTLQRLQARDRHLYLFDTFEGMVAPTDKDVAWTGEQAEHILQHHVKNEVDEIWAYAPLDRVQAAMAGTGFESSHVHCVKGRVEETIPERAPERISVLRLDTDWYESTRHELIHLFPLLSPGGVLIIDDYGHWAGSRKAVDEYFECHGIAILLNRVDYTGRIGIKLA